MPAQGAILGHIFKFIYSEVGEEPEAPVESGVPESGSPGGLESS